MKKNDGITYIEIVVSLILLSLLLALAVNRMGDAQRKKKLKINSQQIYDFFTKIRSNAKTFGTTHRVVLDGTPLRTLYAMNDTGARIDSLLLYDPNYLNNSSNDTVLFSSSGGISTIGASQIILKSTGLSRTYSYAFGSLSGKITMKAVN